ncbi:metallo-beta-lactamase domain-containing protein 1 [Ochlerotatus camptorhynchus]|uniref:metallo-beta-lactamase domain-containing protein 1 n=1 Tax=Ochlerotatus camptorhynchus TaxID=644619 RepID=UPI0031E48DC5
MALEKKLNEIIVLNEGYSYMEQDDDSVMIANCTCTLIKSHDCNIIVDTMTPWDSDLLLQKLQENRMTPDDITWVVSTHGHSDHLGNNNLFLKAKHIVGTNISQRNRYFIHDFNSAPYRLSDTIDVVATPGHTLSCVSVLIRESNLSPGLVAIVGDLFERRDDIADSALWLDAGSEDPMAQRRNRARMAATADYLVPGHGAMFAVDQLMRDELNKQAEESSSSTSERTEELQKKTQE